VDKEAEDSGLRGDVEELREHRHPKMRTRPDRLSRVRRGFIDVVVIFHLDVGHGREKKDNREDNYDHADEGVRDPELFTAGADAGRIFRIEERAARDWAEEQADAV